MFFLSQKKRKVEIKMISYEAATALVFFGISSLLFSATEYLNSFIDVFLGLSEGYISNYLTRLPYYVILILILQIVCQKKTYDIAIRSVFLGCTTAIGIHIILTAPESWTIFGIYVIILSLFHFTEFLAIALTNPEVVTPDSFVLNHSKAYAIAAISSWVEFMIERYFAPQFKQMTFVSIIGLCLCVLGEIMRKSAIFTAKKNFNHIVQNEKIEDHELVTKGVYKICRHPSYVGWFYWSIGTQLVLQNPVCLIAYGMASWKFFEERIYFEEVNLLRFFGKSYIVYQKNVSTGLPFISGYVMDTDDES